MTPSQPKSGEMSDSKADSKAFLSVGRSSSEDLPPALSASHTLELEDLLTVAVADFLRDGQRAGYRFEAARRVNECAAALGITARAAIALATKEKS